MNKEQTKEKQVKEKKKVDRVRLFGIIVVVAAILLILTACIFKYLTSYYKAESPAVTASFEASKDKDLPYYEFDGDPSNEKAVIFYPGGKVEEIAYAPLCLGLKEMGYDVYLMQMTLHLAVFSPDIADVVIESHPEVKEWTMMGHSLGGAMAAKYTSEHEDLISDLVLLGAYSANDLSDSDIDVLLIYGSEDQVLNREKYNENLKNLPDGYVEYVVEGGNHANYAYYGEQKGDGIAEISAKEQQQQVLDQMYFFEEK